MHPDQNKPNQTTVQGGPGPSTNPYDFITNSQPKPKRRWLPSGNSKNQRLLIVIGIVVVVLFLGIFLFAALSASNSAGTSDMVTAAQQQQEIARIADLANQKARQTETKNIATISLETMRSDQETLVAYLKKNGKKVSNKELGLGKDNKVDADLTQAEQDNHFDSTFTVLLAKDVNNYQKTLKDAHDHNSSAGGKKLLEQMYTHAALLSEKLQKLNSSTSQ